MKQYLLSLLHPNSIRGLQSLVYRAAKLRWTLRSGVKIELRSPVDWSTYNEIFVDGEYDKALETAIAGLAPGQKVLHVLDLGANVGFFLLRLLDRIQSDRVSLTLKVVAVEPDEVNSAELSRRVNQQPAEIRSLLEETIVVAAAGERSGSSTLYKSHNYHTHTLLEQQKYSGARGVAVKYIDLETIRPGESWDLVKCDIEGSEKAFVTNYGDLLSRTRVFVVETHNYALDLEVMRPLLRQAGFDQELCISDHGRNALYLFSQSK
jgi:FkbM family methyltransferase